MQSRPRRRQTRRTQTGTVTPEISTGPASGNAKVEMTRIAAPTNAQPTSPFYQSLFEHCAAPFYLSRPPIGEIAASGHGYSH
jgi:hypothetical protein